MQCFIVLQYYHPLIKAINNVILVRFSRITDLQKEAVKADLLVNRRIDAISMKGKKKKEKERKS